MAAVHYPGTPGTILYGGRAAVAPGSELTTLTLQNESASVQAAGFVSPMFGVPFAKGDMPAGSYPQFKLQDGTVCPATLWGITSWPDGSMKFCGAMIRVPASVPGSGTLEVKVQSGGTAPAASSRTTSDLTAANIEIELTGVSGLSGVWVAGLNDAITDAADTVVIASGPAGKIWRIGGECKQSGSAHGQLYVWHYVAALTDGADGLMGLRYLGRVSQPWAEVSSPAPTRRELTAALKVGGATRRNLQGHNSSESVGATLGVGHYTSFFTADTNARWDYVQGGGSAMQDATVRVQHDKVKFIRSRLVPSYDTTLMPDANSAVAYRPYGAAMVQRDMSGTGERPDIGIMTSWSVRHLMRQSAVDETVIRAQGLVSGGWRTCGRKRSTRQVVPTAETAPSYVGLGVTQPTWRVRPGDASSGFVTPSNDTSLWNSEFEPSHRPALTYYPYLVTGEPQFLDMLVEQAANLIANKIPGKSVATVTNPVTVNTIFSTPEWGERDIQIGSTLYKGGGLMFYTGLTRITAWGHRDIAQAAAIYPDTCPAGTEVRKYLRDVIDVNYASINDYNTKFGPDWASFGLVYFQNRFESANPWCHSFLTTSICHASSILPSSAANEFRTYLAQFWENAATTMDIACVYAYGGNPFDGDGIRVNKFSEMLFNLGSLLSFDASTNRVTVSPGGLNHLWSPHNGDVFCFLQDISSANPFPAYPWGTRFYAVNCSGQSMQLSLTPGGAPVTIPATIGVDVIYGRVADFSPNITAEGYIGPSTYIANITGTIRHHAACGDAVSNAVVDTAARFASSGISFVSDPKNAIAPAYPA